MSLRSQQGHLQISNSVAVHPASTTKFAYWGIGKINSDLAGLGVIADAQWDGGAQAAACYYDLQGFPGGTDVGGVASILGGAANTGSPGLIASRPPVGDWFAFYLHQSTSGGSLTFGWYNLTNPSGWVTQSVTGLTSAQVTSYFNQNLTSNSNPIDADMATWRCGDNPLTNQQYLDDLAESVSTHANIFDILLVDATTWTEQSGSGATPGSQGGVLSTGDPYTFPGLRPTIDDQPDDVNANVGNSAVFNISATTSGGTLHYQWKFNGGNVGTDSSTYTRTVGASDSGGAVTCVVSDDNDSVTSNTAYLRIYATAFQEFGLQGDAFQSYASFAASGATTISCSVGNLTLGSVASRVALTTVIRGTVANLTLGNVSARVQLATAVNASRAVLQLNGTPARVQIATAINTTRGNLTLGRVNASVPVTVVVAAIPANLTLGAVAARVQLATAINAVKSTLNLNGVAAVVDVRATTTINATVGGLTLGRVNAKVADTTRINGAPGVLTLGSRPANVIQTTVLGTNRGALTLGSVAARVQLATAINCTVGGLTLGRVNARVQVATAVNTTRAVLTLGSRAATVIVREATNINCVAGSLSLRGVTAQVTTIAPTPPAPPPTVGGGGGPGPLVIRRKRVRVGVQDRIEDRLVIVARTQAVIKPLASQVAAIIQQVSDASRAVQRAHWTPARASIHAVDASITEVVVAKVCASDPDLQEFFDMLMEVE